MYKIIRFILIINNMSAFFKNSLFVVILAALHLCAFSQDKKDETNKKEQVKKGFSPPFIYVGATIGASAYVDVNITSGVQLNKRFNLGLAGKYQYYTLGGTIDKGFSSHIYGYGIYLQTAVIEDFRNIIKLKTYSGLFLHAEYEMLNLNEAYFSDNDPINDTGDRFWLNNILVGPGYIGRFNNTGIFAILLWNVNPNDKNPYEYPLFKVGFTIGI
ncbi:MAG: hypothetical protein A2X13_12415 [Bacteroidetes bacterium GWC2_33_15]|nr:MAG: hypothetical protein A2X10_14280 [Bacteroidetes bacterium GWA2_33_15]OFX50594.1 MAG: hypothetical protein A2X13_12415 [Bacteroidetes bacterium GWC2_33_15]OFX64131.1 MAG: hypothetical protein A2X15_02865 [Bacteroidetes bacterium GWB2_32_14]OFX69743.1 MAG: hypothetical protein A2X14_05090 [Bacteroidetes bacterium GWD2_33_33]HAN19780.1 hypothetical protein [Bacteroidales bacterium]